MANRSPCSINVAAFVDIMFNLPPEPMHSSLASLTAIPNKCNSLSIGFEQVHNVSR